MQVPSHVDSLSLVQDHISARNGAQIVAGPVHGTINLTNSVPSQDSAAESCEAALFQTDPSADRDALTNAKGRRAAGTCEWIKEDTAYQCWLRDSTHLLWIYGGPGKGKTVLSIFLTEELETSLRNSSDSMVLYYFCSSHDSKRNSATSILRGLLWQLVAKRWDFASYMVQSFQTPERAQASVNSPDTLWNILVKVIQGSNLQTTFCLVDGLDECDEESQRWFAAKLCELKQSTNAIKVVIVSRDIVHMRENHAQIRLDSDNDRHIRSDIEKFVSIRVESLSTKVGFDPHFRRAIERQLLERSEGTFLWIGFAMIELHSKRTATEIEETILALPKGLPGIYSRMLLRIGENYKEDCSNILRWITIAFRPLSFKELAAAAGTESTALLSRQQGIRDRITMCGPILKVQEQNVSLVHQSARDYLLRDETDENMALEKYFHIRPENVHLQMAWACLDCISQSNLHDARLIKGDTLKQSEFLSQQRPLLLYAIDHWFEHAAWNSAVTKDLTKHPSGIFKSKSELRDDWWSIYADRSNLLRNFDLPSLHLACFLGITEWARVLLKADRFKLRPYRLLNKCDSEGRTALHHAVRQGRLHTARLLLDSGAAIDAKGSWGRTALSEAAETGQLAMVQLLIERGAEVSPNAGCSESTALHEAARKSHEGVLRFLLEHEAATEARTSRGWTPLYDAVYSSEETGARILLDYGANVNAKETDFGFAPLHEAASSGSETMVRLLLDRGADINIRTGYGATPLREAARKGKWNLVQVFIDRGARVDLKDQDCILDGLAKHRASSAVLGAVETPNDS